MKSFRYNLFSKTLIINCEECLAVQAEWVSSKILNFSQSNELLDGLKINFDWSFFTLRQEGSEFIVCEPDFSKNPFLDSRPNITSTLLTLMGQNNVLQQINARRENISFHSKIIIRKGCFSERKLYLERSTVESPHDSGWYIAPADLSTQYSESDSKDNYDVIYAYQLLDIRPEMLNVLALPYKYLVVFDAEQIEAILDAEGNQVL